MKATAAIAFPHTDAASCGLAAEAVHEQLTAGAGVDAICRNGLRRCGQILRR
jgi:hypothetical protein